MVRATVPAAPFGLVVHGVTPRPSPADTIGSELGAGRSAVLDVRFTPLQAGTFRGSLAITSNDPAQPRLTLPLSGNGVTVP